MYDCGGKLFITFVLYYFNTEGMIHGDDQK